MEKVLKELFDSKRGYLSFFFENIDLEPMQRIVQALLHCTGTLFFSGVGKSGLVAQKIASTIAATGTKALFLSPLDALHGDMGLITAHDVVILLSKSGETEELLSLVPHLDARGVLLVAVTSNRNSRLVKACSLSVDLPLEQELCPFDLAPTTSTTIQMIFGDILAVALMRAKNFTIEQYAVNHPAGRIGKRATLTVQDLMLTGSQIPVCQPHEKILDLLVELSQKRCGCILITSPEHDLYGIFTDGDLRRAIEKFGAQALDKTVEELMTRTPKWITPDILLWDAIKQMEAKGDRQQITVLPVLSYNRKVLGLIKLHDILQAGF